MQVGDADGGVYGDSGERLVQQALAALTTAVGRRPDLATRQFAKPSLIVDTFTILRRLVLSRAGFEGLARDVAGYTELLTRCLVNGLSVRHAAAKFAILAVALLALLALATNGMLRRVGVG